MLEVVVVGCGHLLFDVGVQPTVALLKCQLWNPVPAFSSKLEGSLHGMALLHNKLGLLETPDEGLPVLVVLVSLCIL